MIQFAGVHPVATCLLATLLGCALGALRATVLLRSLELDGTDDVGTLTPGPWT